MKFLEDLPNVDSFLLTSDGLISVSGTQLFNKSENRLITLPENDSVVIEMSSFEEKKIAILYANGRCNILEQDLRIEELPLKCHTSQVLDWKIATYTYDFEILASISNVYDIKRKRKLLENGLVGNSILAGNLLVSYGQDYLSAKSITDNKIDWNFSLNNFPKYLNWTEESTRPKVEQILGVFNELLWVHLGYNLLLSFEIKNGLLKNYFDTIPKGNGKIHLDKVNGNLKILSGFDYYEFNLNSLKLKQTKVSNSISFHKSKYYESDNNLYFCATEINSSFPNIFGIFDTEEKVITWSKVAKEKEQFFFFPPQSNNKTIAIKDSKNTVYVYEK